MSYKLIRFLDKIHEEFISLICEVILEDPIEIDVCEHALC